MFKDIVDSFRGNITRRVTNPFLGTFAVVFLAYYWEPIYAIFTFDEQTTLNARIDFLNNYFGSFSLEILFLLISITFGALLLTYILLSISYVFSNTYNKRVVPFILGKIDQGSIVSREDYDRTQDLVNAYSNKYSEEREKVIQLQTDLENLTRQLSLQSKPDESGWEFVDDKESNAKKLFNVAYDDLKENNLLTDFFRSVNSNDPTQKIYFSANRTASLLGEYNFLNVNEPIWTDYDELASYEGAYLTSLGISFYHFAIDKYSQESS